MTIVEEKNSGTLLQNRQFKLISALAYVITSFIFQNLASPLEKDLILVQFYELSCFVVELD